MKLSGILFALLISMQFLLQSGNAISQQCMIPLHVLGKLKATPQNYKFIRACLFLAYPDIAKIFITQTNAGIAITEEQAYTILREWQLLENNGFISKYWSHAKALLENHESHNPKSISFQDMMLCMEYPSREEICELLRVQYITPSVNNLYLLCKIIPLIELDGLFANFALLKLKAVVKNELYESFDPHEKVILFSWGLITQYGELNSYWMQAFKEFDWEKLSF